MRFVSNLVPCLSTQICSTSNRSTLRPTVKSVASLLIAVNMQNPLNFLEVYFKAHIYGCIHTYAIYAATHTYVIYEMYRPEHRQSSSCALLRNVKVPRVRSRKLLQCVFVCCLVVFPRTQFSALRTSSPSGPL